MTLPSEIEKKLKQKSHKTIIGVDEAGRGPWAGPVVAAAVFLPDRAQNRVSDILLDRITDSKKISEKLREELFDLICEQGEYGIGIVSPFLVDRLNVLGATFRAMQKAVLELSRVLPVEISYVLVDGNLEIPRLSYFQSPVVHGDSLERLIAAASIVAKVTRDRLMLKLDKKYPQYGFAQHKGYGTMGHREALLQYGVCPVHRMSFRPIREIDQIYNS